MSTCSPQILSVSDCKALFLSFAVYFPTNEIIADNITTLIRNICLVRCAAPGATLGDTPGAALGDQMQASDASGAGGYDAAYLPRDLMLATLGTLKRDFISGSVQDTWPFNEQHVFDLIYEIACGSSSTLDGYSMAPLVETLANGKPDDPQSLSLLGWTLLLLSRILAKNKEDELLRLSRERDLNAANGDVDGSSRETSSSMKPMRSSLARASSPAPNSRGRAPGYTMCHYEHVSHCGPALFLRDTARL